MKHVIAIILTVICMTFTFQFMTVDVNAVAPPVEGYPYFNVWISTSSNLVYRYSYENIPTINLNPQNAGEYIIPVIYGGLVSVYKETMSVADYTNGFDNWTYLRTEMDTQLGRVYVPDSMECNFDVLTYTGILYSTASVSQFNYESDISFSLNKGWSDFSIDWSDTTGNLDSIKISYAHGQTFPNSPTYETIEAFNNPYIFDSSNSEYKVGDKYWVVAQAIVNGEVVKTQSWDAITMNSYQMYQVFEDDYKFNLLYDEQGLKITALQNCTMNYLVEVPTDLRTLYLGSTKFMDKDSDSTWELLMGDSVWVSWSDLGLIKNSIQNDGVGYLKISASQYQVTDEMILVYSGTINHDFSLSTDIDPDTGLPWNQFYNMTVIDSDLSIEDITTQTKDMAQLGANGLKAYTSIFDMLPEPIRIVMYWFVGAALLVLTLGTALLILGR